jgi:hypothetical protein
MIEKAEPFMLESFKVGVFVSKIKRKQKLQMFFWNLNERK